MKNSSDHPLLPVSSNTVFIFQAIDKKSFHAVRSFSILTIRTEGQWYFCNHQIMTDFRDIKLF